MNLLGKSLRLKDEDKLFELVQNNIIDGIKPDNINNLLAKGITHHKDDYIEM